MTSLVSKPKRIQRKHIQRKVIERLVANGFVSPTSSGRTADSRSLIRLLVLLVEEIANG